MEKTNFIGYIGTYTKGESKGIYRFVLDTAAQTIEGAEVAAELDNPTYLTISPDQRQLYAVVKHGNEGGVAAYALDAKTGALSFLNQESSEGAPPCHISTDKETSTVVIANYHKGTIESYRVQDNGSVSPVVSVIQHTGSGPDPRQEKPHAHYAGFTPDGQYVVAIDLGTDEIITYKAENSVLTEAASLSIKPGSGPRHIAFHPNGKYAYVMTEFSSEVIVLTYEQGHFTEVQYISTIPSEFTANNQGSAIHLSSDGRFVYAGNRGHDSIAVFRVDADTGMLTFVAHTATEGNWPRDFVLDPTESFVIAANQESGNLVLFARDATAGTLRLLQKDVLVPDPVCVKFLV